MESSIGNRVFFAFVCRSMLLLLFLYIFSSLFFLYLFQVWRLQFQRQNIEYNGINGCFVRKFVCFQSLNKRKSSLFRCCFARIWFRYLFVAFHFCLFKINCKTFSTLIYSLFEIPSLLYLFCICIDQLVAIQFNFPQLFFFFISRTKYLKNASFDVNIHFEDAHITHCVRV